MLDGDSLFVRCNEGSLSLYYMFYPITISLSSGSSLLFYVYFVVTRADLLVTVCLLFSWV